MILPATLSTAAGAALVNFWLATRVLRLRLSEKVIHGDGGHALLARRMRAHSNYIEYTPFILILIAGIELAGKGGGWLLPIGGVYLFARIAHAFGMDSAEPTPPRQIGMAVTFLTLLGLAVYAVLIVARVM